MTAMRTYILYWVTMVQTFFADVLRKTHASQASSEKLMCLKQELATAAQVSGVLKREQLKHEASQQAIAVWEKREDFASLKRKFPSLLSKKRTKELRYDKERVAKILKLTEPAYVYHYFLSCAGLRVSIELCSVRSREREAWWRTSAESSRHAHTHAP